MSLGVVPVFISDVGVVNGVHRPAQELIRPLLNLPVNALMSEPAGVNRLLLKPILDARVNMEGESHIPPAYHPRLYTGVG